MSLTEEIHFHWKALVDADETEKYALGLTETEYHMGKIIDRILIDTGHGRMKIRIQLEQGEKRERNTFKHKNYVIDIFPVTPDTAWLEYEKTDDISVLSGEEIGRFGYRVYDQEQNLVYEDLYNMGDKGACLENAKNEIRVLIEGLEEWVEEDEEVSDE